MAQWTEFCPENQRTAVEFPVRAHAWVVGRVPVGSMQEATTHWCFSPSFSLPCPLFKVNKYDLLKSLTVNLPGHLVSLKSFNKNDQDPVRDIYIYISQVIYIVTICIFHLGKQVRRVVTCSLAPCHSQAGPDAVRVWRPGMKSSWSPESWELSRS